MPEHHRNSDPQVGVTITRSIPLWGLLCIAGAGALQAGLWWFQMQEQGRAIAELKAQNIQVIATLAEINKQLSSTNLKDLEHDLKINNLTNRVQAIESLYPRQLPPSPASR